MAKALALPPPSDRVTPKEGSLRWLLTLGLLTLLSAAIGGGFGLVMVSGIQKQVEEKYKALPKKPEIVSPYTGQDVLAYIRTLSLAQIQGPSGLLHLREDLNERVRLRSKGAIQELVLETLIVQ
jgi:flagellar FliL protein